MAPVKTFNLVYICNDLLRVLANHVAIFRKVNDICWYHITEEIQKAVTGQLNKIPAEDLSNAMNKLETRANLCITSNGSYFE
jgi:hypothetical protein